MRVKVKYLVLGLLAVAASGCSSLKQSSLVYSSQNNIGVVIKGGSAQAGNFDLTLGYSGHDFAIVPVAVAETCAELSEPTDCDPARYKLVKITGANDVDAAAQAYAGLATQLTRQSNILLDEKRALAERKTQAEAAAAKFATQKTSLGNEIQKIKDKIEQIDETVPDEATSEADIAKSKSDLNFEVTQIETEIKGIDNLVAENERAVKMINGEIASIDENLIRIRQQLSDLGQRNSRSSTDTKNDALSVYGEFAGGTSTRGTDATLNVGKVFSTGVAAQNLTQQMGQVLASQATGRCLGSAIGAIKDDVRLKSATAAEMAELYKSAMSMCTAPEPDSET